MKILIIILIFFTTLIGSEIIKNTNTKIQIIFYDLLKNENGIKLWKSLKVIYPNKKEKIITYDFPFISNGSSFSPDGEFLIYRTTLQPLESEQRLSNIDCGVLDLVGNRSFFDTPALSRCRSEWYQKENHTLFNAHEVDE